MDGSRDAYRDEKPDLKVNEELHFGTLSVVTGTKPRNFYVSQVR